MVAALRGGDADRFDDLVGELTPGMVRIARMYVSAALADDVVQDTWLAVIDAIDTFEGRSSLKTWIYRILLNKVRTLATREARAVPVASLGADRDPAGPRLELVHEELGPGYWPAPPEPWETLGPERLERNEILDRIAEAIEALPTAQREVVELRDVQGWSASDTADVLGITDVNQRVLLHRGRQAIRNALEEYLRAS
jgi:RNA polymerase sigma-70 factor (ECF subfamily)